MNKIFSRILLFALLTLVQVFILNKIHLFGYATPFLYLYFILTLKQDLSRNKLMLWSFAIGLVVDIFSNTFGIHAAACTLIAFLRPPLLRLLAMREESDPDTPGIRSMGAGAFRRYAFITILIHHAVVFMLEYFSFAYPLPLAISILSSTIFTLLMVMSIEHIIGNKS